VTTKAGYGGAIGLSSTAPDLINNTISNNRPMKEAYISYFSSPSDYQFYYLWKFRFNKQRPDYLYGNMPFYLNYCDIESGISGIKTDTAYTPIVYSSDNIDINPMYNNAGSYDYSLGEKSECIDPVPQMLKTLTSCWLI